MPTFFSRVNDAFMRNWLHWICSGPKRVALSTIKITYFTRRSDYKGGYMARFQCRSLLCEFTYPTQIIILTYTVFSRLNAGSVYLKFGLVDPAFIRTRRLFGARRLSINCIFQYWKFIEPRTKIQQKRLKNVKQCHQLCLI